MLNDQNIYKSPESDPGSQDTGVYRFYKLSGIGLATFFGSPIAGGYLISRNYKVVGRDAEAKKAIIYSVLGTLAMFAVITFIESFFTLPNTTYSVPQVMAVYLLARQYQGELLETHKTNNGQFFSNWRAFGISLVVILAILIVLVPIIYFLPFFEGA